MFKNLRFWAPTTSKDEFEVKIALLKKCKPTRPLYAHKLINLAKDIVLFYTKTPSQSNFDNANKLLWTLAAMLTSWSVANKSNLHSSNSDNQGNTPLHLISQLCFEACYQNPQGLSSWEAINDVKGYESFTLSGPISYMFSMLVNKLNVNQQNANGETPLHILSGAYEKDLIPEPVPVVTELCLGFNAFCILLGNGADITIEDNKQQSCYSLASEYRSENELKELIRRMKNYDWWIQHWENLGNRIKDQGVNEIKSRKLKI